MKVRSKAAQLIMQKQNQQYDKQINNNVKHDKHNKNSNELQNNLQNQNTQIQKDPSQKRSNIKDNSAKNPNNFSNLNNMDSKSESKNNKNRIHKINLDQYLVLDLNLTSNIQNQEKNSQSKSKQNSSSIQKQKNLPNRHSELEMQNYRLIQVNYQMIQRNEQLFQTMKNKLLQALNFIEDFSYAEGVKVIYKLLNYLKSVEQLNNSTLIQKKQKNKQNSQNLQKQSKKQPFLKNISEILKFDYIPQPKVSFEIFNKPQGLEEQIRINIQNIQKSFIEEYDQNSKYESKFNEKGKNQRKNQNQNQNLIEYSHNKNRSFNQGVKPFQSERIIDKKRRQSQFQSGYLNKTNIQESNFYIGKNNDFRQRQKEDGRSRTKFNINLFKNQFKTESVQSIVDTYSQRDSQMIEYSRVGDKFREHQVTTRKSIQQQQIIFHKTSRAANQQAYRMMLVQANVIQSLHSKLFK